MFAAYASAGPAAADAEYVQAKLFKWVSIAAMLVFADANAFSQILA